MSLPALNTLQCLHSILAKDTQGPLRSIPCLCCQQENHLSVIPLPGCNIPCHCLGLLLIGRRWTHLVLVQAVASAARLPASLCLTHRSLGPCASYMYQYSSICLKKISSSLHLDGHKVPTALCTSGTAGLRLLTCSWLLEHASLSVVPSKFSG